MWYSLSVMIGDGKGSFWCGTKGKYMFSEATSRARAGPGEEEEEEEKSSIHQPAVSRQHTANTFA